MKLKEYLDRNGLTFREFAALIEVADGRTVHRYAAGERLPRRAVMTRIAAQTRGAVTAADFFDSA
ncbi:helix-turn-helix domain-containing protein [Azospirillum doebereinerae]|uniref:XRE family transcriptional regulator n=1 Tax=Azospirillum doebereinerae TaxID=92933 RepID=A0A3S0V3S2_9PROT|nr:helix-turn-helix transcriptional regulator [Azospirillum doebereinerae]RUQ66016.1 XRE family transcriptional regulator [Azospirillum doebereinerae]